MGLHRVLLFSMLALAAAGCARKPVARVAPPPGPAVAVAPAPVAVVRAPVVVAPVPVAVAPMAFAEPEPPYRLDSGDRLRVVVFGQEGLTNTFSVDAAGMVTLPLIGSIHARGLTTTALSAAIAARLKQGFVREPHVAVEIEAYRPFFILGEVTAPGQYPFVAHMTAETAVAIAGGFTPRAYKPKVQVSRNVDGVLVRSTVPLPFPIMPGDTINVSERWF